MIKKIIKYTFTSIILILILLISYPYGYFILQNESASSKFNSNSSIESYKNTSIYVINLASSKDRYSILEPKLQKIGLPIKRIEAVDGRILLDKELQEKVDFKTFQNFMGRLPKRGEVGCYLSHIKTWESFLNSQDNFAFIVEDDIDFDPLQVLKKIQYLTCYFKDWDLVSFELSHEGNPLIFKQLDSKSQLVVYLFKVTNSGAYLITRSTAQKLLRKALPLKVSLDYYFTRGWELDFRFMGLEPRLITQNQLNNISYTKSSSDHYIFIQSNSLITNKARKILSQIQSDIIQIIYNFKIYIQNKII